MKFVDKTNLLANLKEFNNKVVKTEIKSNAKDAIYTEAVEATYKAASGVAEDGVDYYSFDSDSSTYSKATVSVGDDVSSLFVVDVPGSSAKTIAEAIADLKENGGSLTITEDTSDSAVLKKYKFSQNGSDIGTINIPLDLVVSSGVVETYTADALPDGVTEAGTYIKLVIANQETPLYINVKDLNQGDAVEEATTAPDGTVNKVFRVTTDGVTSVYAKDTKLSTESETKSIVKNEARDGTYLYEKTLTLSGTGGDVIIPDDVIGITWNGTEYDADEDFTTHDFKFTASTRTISFYESATTVTYKYSTTISNAIANAASSAEAETSIIDWDSVSL